MRRKRKNPGVALLAVAGVAVVGVVAAFLLFGSKKRTETAITAPDGTKFVAKTEPATDRARTEIAESIVVGDCVAAVQGQAGFSMPWDVPTGENMLFRVTSGGGRSGQPIQAVPNDSRATTSASVVIPTGALAGVGECA